MLGSSGVISTLTTAALNLPLPAVKVWLVCWAARLWQTSIKLSKGMNLIETILWLKNHLFCLKKASRSAICCRLICFSRPEVMDDIFCAFKDFISVRLIVLTSLPAFFKVMAVAVSLEMIPSKDSPFFSSTTQRSYPLDIDKLGASIFAIIASADQL